MVRIFTTGKTAFNSFLYKMFTINFNSHSCAVLLYKLRKFGLREVG